MTCVNALNGLISFLHEAGTKVEPRRLCVNALNGLISFLRCFVWYGATLVICVNALNGLISFLHVTLGKKAKANCTGVNALNGLISFLHAELDEAQADYKELCQCPKRANFISTLYIRRNEKWRKWVSMP